MSLASGEITLSAGQIEDSVGLLKSAVDSTFSSSDQETGYYRPDTAEVPRPSFRLFKESLEASSVNSRWLDNATVRLLGNKSISQLFNNFAGLRAIAIFAIGGTASYIRAPAIVLPGGKAVGVLTAESQLPPLRYLSDLQQALLENEYLKSRAKVDATHSAADITNAGDIAPALVVASSVETTRAHASVHALASSPSGQSFGANFAEKGWQDIRISNQTRKVRSAILPISRVALDVASYHQLPRGVELLGLKLTPQELAVGMTLAATTTQHKVPDLKANLANMVGE